MNKNGSPLAKEIIEHYESERARLLDERDKAVELLKSAAILANIHDEITIRDEIKSFLQSLSEQAKGEMK